MSGKNRIQGGATTACRPTSATDPPPRNVPRKQPPTVRGTLSLCTMGDRSPIVSTKWLVRAGKQGRIHTCDPGAPYTCCGILVNDDWLRLRKGTSLDVIDCPVCFTRLFDAVATQVVG